MNILVTGGAGFLGKNLITELLNRGYTVWSFSRNEYLSLNKIGVKTIRGDLVNEESVISALKNIDVVFHVASKVGMWGDYKDFYQTNVIGTKNIIKACKIHKVKKLIYTSSPSVVFGSKDLCNEDESINYPQKFYSDYAKTKAMAEKLVLEANSSELKTVAIRPHLIFGKDDPHLIPRIIEMAKKGKLKRVGSGKNLVDVTYIQNAVDAHLKAFDNLFLDAKVAGKAYFIGQERPVNLWDFIDQILVLHNLPKIKKSVPFKVAYSLGSICEKSFKLLKIKSEPPMTRFIAMQFAHSHYFNHKNATKDFGYNPKILLEEALTKTVRL